MIPLHPAIRRFLVALQCARARYLVRTGMSYEGAAEEATALALAFEGAITDGTLIPMPTNVICREMAGRVL